MRSSRIPQVYLIARRNKRNATLKNPELIDAVSIFRLLSQARTQEEKRRRLLMRERRHAIFAI
jgi:hypothetical protein